MYLKCLGWGILSTIIQRHFNWICPSKLTIGRANQKLITTEENKAVSSLHCYCHRVAFWIRYWEIVSKARCSHFNRLIMKRVIKYRYLIYDCHRKGLGYWILSTIIESNFNWISIGKISIRRTESEGISSECNKAIQACCWNHDAIAFWVWPENTIGFYLIHFDCLILYVYVKDWLLIDNCNFEFESAVLIMRLRISEIEW